MLHKKLALIGHSVSEMLEILVSEITTRTEQLAKCCEPQQKMRIRLGACKTV